MTKPPTFTVTTIKDDLTDAKGAWEESRVEPNSFGHGYDTGMNEGLQRYAPRLISALNQAHADRELVAQWMMDHSYATGHGDTIADLLAELHWQHEEYIGQLKENQRTPGAMQKCVRCGATWYDYMETVCYEAETGRRCPIQEAIQQEGHITPPQHTLRAALDDLLDFAIWMTGRDGWEDYEVFKKRWPGVHAAAVRALTKPVP